MLKSLVPFIRLKEIDQMCQKLASEITKDYKELDPILICPLKGSIFFLNHLIQYLDFPLKIDFVSISLNESRCHLRKDISVPIKNKHVLIVEEIIDNGRKVHFLRERLLISSPASVKIVSLLDKISRRDLPIHIDYVGQQIDDRFVVGYGMDADELGRNYRDIYIFAQ